MEKVSRDVLIVSKLSVLSEKALEQEYQHISQLLHNVETLQMTCIATEIHDLSRYKIIRKPHLVLDALKKRQTAKPFVFLFNKN